MTTNDIDRIRAEQELKYGPIHEGWRPGRLHLPVLAKARVAKIPRAKLLETAARAKIARIAAARRDPNAFIEYAFRDSTGEPLRQAWFHEEWQEAIAKHPRLLIAGPRGSGKSEQIIARAIWELGHNPDLRIKIVCASDAKAVERLLQIREHLERNPQVREVFPGLIAAERGRWTQHKMIVKRTSISRDASVEALGIMSTATGGRADLLIADDVVDQRNALLMPALRDAVKKAWFSNWVQLLQPDGRIVYISTLWHKLDLSHALLVNTTFHKLVYAVGENGEAIWPEVWSQERLLKRREEIGPLEFSRAYRNIPQDESYAPVHPDWIQYEDVGKLTFDDVELVLSCDLAIGDRDDNDYFGAVVLAVQEKARKAYIVDAWRARLSAPEQVERIVKEAKHWNKATVLVEDVAYQASLAQFLHQQEPWLNVQLVRPQGSKRMRVNRIAPHLKNGQVVFASQMDPARLAKPNRGDLVSELLDFPLGRHDDMVDALTQGVIWISDTALAEEEYRRPPAGVSCITIA
ncbi:MAG: phage terminase large subunit [Deltaproteobacteria bacterium]|nr:phage terminase large subunit [Deltaproteobacteria bacterium]